MEEIMVKTRKSNSRPKATTTLRKLPYNISKQLAKIYFQKNFKKWPHKTPSKLILLIGAVSSILLLARYFRNK